MREAERRWSARFSFSFVASSFSSTSKSSNSILSYTKFHSAGAIYPSAVYSLAPPIFTNPDLRDPASPISRESSPGDRLWRLGSLSSSNIIPQPDIEVEKKKKIGKKEKCTTRIRTNDHTHPETTRARARPLYHPSPISDPPGLAAPSRAVPGQKVSPWPVPLRHGGGGYLKDLVALFGSRNWMTPGIPPRGLWISATRDTCSTSGASQNFVDHQQLVLGVKIDLLF